jgi:hypothetical protein
MDAVEDIEFFVNLSFCFAGREEPRQILTIPLQKCYEFSRKPLKWLRYLGYYTLYGREGHIFTKIGEGEEPVDYESQKLEPRHHHYYFHSQGKGGGPSPRS